MRVPVFHGLFRGLLAAALCWSVPSPLEAAHPRGLRAPLTEPSAQGDTVSLDTVRRVPLRAEVLPGVEVLRDMDFAPLRGKRVGLVTNPTGVDRRLCSTIDILFHAPGVKLVALFGPEHGVRGDAHAGDLVSASTDPRTGLPVHSLYGKHREPSPEMLAGLDIVVYDIQDTGTRSYTFISTLGLVMRACARAGVEVMVLDRPNPLGGLKVEGPNVRHGFHSFVGQYAIPYVYGLTVGELAMLLNGEGLNCGQRGTEEPLSCRLSVIPMQGWKRSMRYGDTGLPWILPSPNIPSPAAAEGYPSAGIAGECGCLNIGVGYTLPFQVFAAPWVDADALCARLDSMQIPGVAFRPIHFRPFSGSMAGKTVHGVQYHYTDFEAATITLTQFYVMEALAALCPGRIPNPPANTSMVDKVCGSDKPRTLFFSRMRVEDMVADWNADVASFRALSRRYWLYPVE